LAEQVRQLNVQIASTEGGNSSASQAGGLRDRRQAALDRLSELIGVHVSEQPSGGVSVAVGGDFLVFEGIRREVTVEKANQSGDSGGIIKFADTNGVLDTSTGEVKGLYTARDDVVGGFMSKLDDLAGTLAFEFNKVYSQGQGLVGFQNLSSVESVRDSGAALDAAGLPFAPTSGTFDLLVHSKGDNLTRTHTIRIDLDGMDEDTTLASLAQQLDAVDGISASITATGTLQLSADSTDIEFSFSGDTSGVLAALGLNTFFTGSTAGSIGVNSEVKGIDNAGKFAASLGGIGQDSKNAERMATFLDQPLESAGNASLADKYSQMLNEITQGSSVASSVAEGFRTFEGTLQGQQQAVSGVSIDEEAVNMLTLQRIYQASAKYIQTVADLLDLLVKI
jgi:flagellar hook-associated protein 1 FlgK